MKEKSELLYHLPNFEDLLKDEKPKFFALVRENTTAIIRDKSLSFNQKMERLAKLKEHIRTVKEESVNHWRTSSITENEGTPSEDLEFIVTEAKHAYDLLTVAIAALYEGNEGGVFSVIPGFFRRRRR